MFHQKCIYNETRNQMFSSFSSDPLFPSATTGDAEQYQRWKREKWKDEEGDSTSSSESHSYHHSPLEGPEIWGNLEQKKRSVISPWTHSALMDWEKERVTERERERPESKDCKDQQNKFHDLRNGNCNVPNISLALTHSQHQLNNILTLQNNQEQPG